MIGLLERLRSNNVKLNEKKVKFKTDKVTYMGYLITNKGLEEDPAKVEAISEMPTPQNVNELKLFWEW